MELTTRDFEILEYLYHQGVATRQQLTELFFKSEISARVRLHSLKKNGFLESKSLSELKTISDSVYRNARNIDIFNSQKELHKYRLYSLGPRIKRSFSRSEVISQPIMWKHQVQLNRIRTFLEGMLTGATILSDPEIREYWDQFSMGNDEVIPDLAVLWNNLKIAIELERNLKSELAYYSRFLSYKGSKYSQVIYFCETEKIFKALVQQSSTFYNIGISSILSPNKIFQKLSGFVSLKEFLTSSI